MTESQLLFDERLQRLGQAHRALERGYTTRMRGDGLVVRVPKRARPTVPWRKALAVPLVFLMVKVFLIVSLGETTYAERLEQLRHGSAVDRGGAVLMQIDPLSRALVHGVETLRG